MRVNSVRVDTHKESFDPLCRADITFNIETLHDIEAMFDKQTVLEAKAGMMDEMLKQIKELKEKNNV